MNESSNSANSTLRNFKLVAADLVNANSVTADLVAADLVAADFSLRHCWWTMFYPSTVPRRLKPCGYKRFFAQVAASL